MDCECEELIAIDIPAELPPAERPECCICRVPKKLCMVNKEAYTPKLVSIGPFHHGQNEVSDMKMHKLRYLKAFLDWTGKRQEDLLKIIKGKEEKIRHCYSEDFRPRISNNHFVNMILLDAIFIIELFRRTKANIGVNEENDFVVKKPWLANGIRLDLILLENQLPFFILKKLYKFAGPNYHKSHKGGQNKEVTFLELSLNYFHVYHSNRPDHMQLPEEFNIREVKHFTELIKYVFCSVSAPSMTMKRNLEDLDNRICATKLDDAGLKFKESMQCILEIPTLVIDDNTEALFRNLIALEQCHYPLQPYICNYAALVDYLIDTENDVDLLVQKKVIVKNIGSNEAVVKLITQLCHEMVVLESCYADLGKEINDFSYNYLNRIMATMKNEFFRDFWRGTATTVELVVMLYQ